MILYLWLFFLANGSVIADKDNIEDEIENGKHFASLMKTIYDPYTFDDTEIGAWMNENIFITWYERDKPEYVEYMNTITEGLTEKAIPLNLYNTKMLSETKALIHLLASSSPQEFFKTATWARYRVNEYIFLYAVRAALLYSQQGVLAKMASPVSINPYYYFNSEAMRKIANFNLKIRMDENEMRLNEISLVDGNKLIVKANYSAWNVKQNACEKELEYFREDIGMNAYFLGLQLLHPFWMSETEFSKYTDKHYELYYYHYQQLIARYKLERESLNLGGIEDLTESCDYADYNPYLDFPSGYSFPVRKNFDTNIKKNGMLYLLEVDRIVGYIVREKTINSKFGESINLTKSENMPKLIEIIRENLDNVIYGSNLRKLISDEFSPEISVLTPSTISVVETSLRDPIYWKIINKVLNHVIEFKNGLPRRPLSSIKSSSIKIQDVKIVTSPTYFDSFHTDISLGVIGNKECEEGSDFKYIINQDRITHDFFEIEITVEASANVASTIRIFMGPKCEKENCEIVWDRMFEIDTFKQKIYSGKNIIVWSDKNSTKYIDEDIFDVRHKNSNKKNYNLYKWPRRFSLPRGSREGFEVTFFVLITEENVLKENIFSSDSLYSQISKSIDGRPLGFPFEQPFIYDTEGKNYQFVKAFLYHAFD